MLAEQRAHALEQLLSCDQEFQAKHVGAVNALDELNEVLYDRIERALTD